MKPRKILIAENRRTERARELLALSTFVKEFSNVKLIPMSDAGFDFKTGSDPVKMVRNLSKISQEISLAFEMTLLPDGPNQQLLRMGDCPSVTIEMINDVIVQLQGETERGCTYICEIAIGFPTWAMETFKIPSYISKKVRMHGEFGKTPVPKPPTEKRDGDCQLIRVGGSWIPFDHIFVPDNNPERKTIAEFPLGKRYLDGLLGRALQALMIELNYGVENS